MSYIKISKKIYLMILLCLLISGCASTMSIYTRIDGCCSDILYLSVTYDTVLLCYNDDDDDEFFNKNRSISSKYMINFSYV